MANKYFSSGKQIAKSIALIVTGTLILSFGTAVFIIPHDLVSGGVSGLSIVINKVTGGLVPTNLLISVLTWTTFLFGLIFLGKEFAAKTLLSSIIYPLGISLFGLLAKNGIFNIGESQYPQLAVLLSAVFGGLLAGTGCAVTFLGGGSTGGVDIIAFCICKYRKRLKSPTVIFVIDAVIVLFGAFAVGDPVVTMLGIVAAIVSAIAMDRIFLGGSRAFVAQIVSDNCAEINRGIIEELKRTATLIDAVGGYSGKPKKMLTVSFTYTQYAALMRIISSADSRAFVTVHRAHRVGGEGWHSLTQ